MLRTAGEVVSSVDTTFWSPTILQVRCLPLQCGSDFLDCLERDGTTSLDVPGEAHEQMGDVEAQGQHFEQMLVRVLQEANPKTYPEWVECVGSTVEARNMLMKRHGYSAYQMVFGRDPKIPGDDLLSKKPNVITNSATLEDGIAEYAHHTPMAARQAVLQSLDHKAAGIALNSRPRPTREFEASRRAQRGGVVQAWSCRWKCMDIHAWCVCEVLARTGEAQNWRGTRGRPVSCS